MPPNSKKIRRIERNLSYLSAYEYGQAFTIAPFVE
jgi:hypothetical protein